MTSKKRKADHQELLDKLAEILAAYREDNTSEEGRHEPRRGGGTVHQLKKDAVCSTDERGFKTPGNRTPGEIVLDASEGFIPLWRYGSTLRWCFDEVALSSLGNSSQWRDDVRGLLIAAMEAWGDSAPVKLKEERDSYDFKVVIHNSDDCSPFGCTLARAFFPDSGRHNLEMYPKMFEQSDKEQVDTVIHELGHVFGLRHFFAQVRETAWPSVIFGKHRAFSIMNYGALSELTDDDKSDLKNLYQAVWTGELTEISGTPIKLFAPYHEAGELVIPRTFRQLAAS